MQQQLSGIKQACHCQLKGQTPSLAVALGKLCLGQQSRVAFVLEAPVMIA